MAITLLIILRSAKFWSNPFRMLLLAFAYNAKAVFLDFGTNGVLESDNCSSWRCRDGSTVLSLYLLNAGSFPAGCDSKMSKNSQRSWEGSKNAIFAAASAWNDLVHHI